MSNFISPISQNHRITECSGLEGTSVGHLVQPIHLGKYGPGYKVGTWFGGGNQFKQFCSGWQLQFMGTFHMSGVFGRTKLQSSYCIWENAWAYTTVAFQVWPSATSLWTNMRLIVLSVCEIIYTSGFWNIQLSSKEYCAFLTRQDYVLKNIWFLWFLGCPAHIWKRKSSFCSIC